MEIPFRHKFTVGTRKYFAILHTKFIYEMFNLMKENTCIKVNIYVVENKMHLWLYGN